MKAWQRILVASIAGEIAGFALGLMFYITPEIALDFPYTWLFYSFIAWLCLGLAARLRGNWVPLFLIGSAFGKVLKGVQVATIHDSPPRAGLFAAILTVSRAPAPSHCF